MADSPTIEAWRELHAAQLEMMQEGDTARDPRIQIGDTSNVICVIGEDNNDPAFFAGGVASTGQMTVQTILADWGNDMPQKTETATITGMALGNTYTGQVLSTVERNGILYILLGDNSAQ